MRVISEHIQATHLPPALRKNIPPECMVTVIVQTEEAMETPKPHRKTSERLARLLAIGGTAERLGCARTTEQINRQISDFRGDE